MRERGTQNNKNIMAPFYLMRIAKPNHENMPLKITYIHEFSREYKQAKYNMCERESARNELKESICILAVLVILFLLLFYI